MVIKRELIIKVVVLIRCIKEIHLFKYMLNNFLFHYGIPFYNYLVETSNYIYNTITYIKNKLYSGANSNRLVFFSENPHAYIASYIRIDTSSIILWNYDRYLYLFYMYKCSIKDTKRLPLLCAKLTLDNKEIYNLDTFVDRVRIDSSNCGYPTPIQLLEAWAYSEGYVLDRREKYMLEYFDSSLNEYTINPLTEDFIFNKIKRV